MIVVGFGGDARSADLEHYRKIEIVHSSNRLANIVMRASHASNSFLHRLILREIDDQVTLAEQMSS